MLKHLLRQLVDGRWGSKTAGEVVFVRNGTDLDIFFRDQDDSVHSLRCAGAGRTLMPDAEHGTELVFPASLVKGVP